MRYLKVVAYITRRAPGGPAELLVFDHRDDLNAGTQVPAGTVEDGEQIDDALVREVFEESGLGNLHVVRMLAHYEWIHPVTGNIHERHVFHLEAPPGVPDEWTWIETSGGEVPDDEGHVFVFRWVPLDRVPLLAGGFGDHLDTLRTSLS